MAGLRKACAYSKRKARPYTRISKVRKKSYIKTVPPSQVVKMKMGDLKGYVKGKYPIELHIISKEKVQIRDNSIESVRQFLNRFLQIQVGKEHYLEIKIYPHHILRENKMLTGAGADRMQTGMAQSFGKTIGRAALVKANQLLIIVAVPDKRREAAARKLISSVKSRLPCKISIETIVKKPEEVIKKE
jgi:large subunit ribosomal protein L10e